MIKNINSTDADKIISEKDIKLIDCRTLTEYRSGHIKNAVNIDIYSPDFQEKISKLDKSEKYIIYCQTGSRSSAGVGLMDRLGFTEVYNMVGGVMDWDNNGFKLTK